MLINTGGRIDSYPLSILERINMQVERKEYRDTIAVGNLVVGATFYYKQSYFMVLEPACFTDEGEEPDVRDVYSVHIGVTNTGVIEHKSLKNKDL